ncbi:MAG: hypothetical protein J6C44_09595 [Muribaculaceae bacterium]|nr:hypothetical protein [Muribaculaceae bacterium]
MKFYKYSILAMMGLAVSLTSCSDDDDYTVGSESAGPYFSSTLAKAYEVDKGESYVTFDVTRTDKAAAATYNLVFTDPSGLFTAPASVTFDAGEDVAPVKVTFDFDKLKAGTTYKLKVAIEEGQAYIYGNDAYEFSVSVPVYVSFCDPFIIPGFGVKNTDYIWQVKLNNGADEDTYSLEAPYQIEECPIYEFNQLAGKEKAKIEFNVSIPECVYIYKDYAGFKDDEGTYVIANWAGYVWDVNKNASGATLASIMDFMVGKGWADRFSTFEDGVITIPFSLFGVGADPMGDDFGYTWKNPQTGYIFFPEASENAKAKVCGRKVTRPAISGMLGIVETERLIANPDELRIR